MSIWEAVVKKSSTTYDQTIKIGVIAKYLDNEDTYYSVVESLKIAAWDQAVNLEISWVDAEKVDENTDDLKNYDGILVPGGFGTRGVEGKITAAGWALENNKPYLGLCLGLQAAVIAAARNAGVEGGWCDRALLKREFARPAKRPAPSLQRCDQRALSRVFA
jgi:CTP synthase